MAVTFLRKLNESVDKNLIRILLDTSDEDLAVAMKIVSDHKQAYDKLSPELNEIKDPNAPRLPDGHLPVEKFIESNEVAVGLSGDLNEPQFSDDVVVYAYSEDKVQYSKRFDFYKDLSQAIDLVNHLVDEIDDDMGLDEVRNICKKYNLSQD